MENINNYDIATTHKGELYFRGADVYRQSFLSVLYSRIFRALMCKNNLSCFQLTPQKIVDILNRITINKEWLRLISQNDLSWKDQFRIINNESLSDFELNALMLKAEQFGYLYSEYHATVYPHDVDPSRLPFLIHQNADDTIDILGESPYKLDFLKNRIIEQRNTYYAQIIERDNDWHCFFSLSKGIWGQESGHKQHIHYVSSKAPNVSLAEWIKTFKTGNYKRPYYHINFSY